MIRGFWQSEVIHEFIVADLDHLIINQQEMKEGYDAKNGFVKQILNQYSSIVTMRPPSSPDSFSRALYAITIMHELIKFVYYAESPMAESQILSSHPSVASYWKRLKPSIDRYTHNPSPGAGWKFAAEYVEVMDSMTDDCAASFRFSQLIGFSPAQISEKEVASSASLVFWEFDTPDGRFHRIFKGKFMVGVTIGPKPDFSSNMVAFAMRNKIDFRIRTARFDKK
jgi:hypothetical protein